MLYVQAILEERKNPKPSAPNAKEYWEKYHDYYYSPKEVSPWFPGDTAPMYKGMYERHFSDGVDKQYWNGKSWYAVTIRTKEGAEYIATVPHWRQVGDYPMWRGVITKPTPKLWSIITPDGKKYMADTLPKVFHKVVTKEFKNKE